MAVYFKIPKPVLRATAVLCAIAAGIGIWLGARGLPTESDVILTGAALFVSETGGDATECVGVPGEGLAWIAVRCGKGEALRVYYFDRQGGRLSEDGEAAA